MENKFDILLIEDNPSDAKVIEIYLKEAYNTDDYTFTRANNLKAGLKFIAFESFNVILLDLVLPDSTGLSTLQKVLKKAYSHEKHTI